MAKIKRIGIFDVIKARKLVSFLESTEFMPMIKILCLLPLSNLQNILPLMLKKFPEAYVSIDNEQLNGMILLKASYGNPFKWNITKLYLAKNSYTAGRQLIDYVLAKYGAQGANTFCVTFNNNYEELLDLFSKGCGFRLCSHENLWKMSQLRLSRVESDDIFRPFKNSDSKEVCDLYNDGIYPHFRYSLSKEPDEFKEKLLQGFSNSTSFKYVMTDEYTKKIKSYIEIQTTDNYNYTLDVILPSPYEKLYPTVLSFAINQIVRRKKDFNMFLWNKNYMTTAKTYAEFLRNQGFSHIQNNVVLVKDFFKTINSCEKITKPAIAFNEINTNPAFSKLSD